MPRRVAAGRFQPEAVAEVGLDVDGIVRAALASARAAGLTFSAAEAESKPKTNANGRANGSAASAVSVGSSARP